VITERAKSSFDHLVVSSIKTSMPVESASVTVEPMDSLDKIKEKKIVILTVSSYLFRAIVIIYFKADAATRAAFNRNAAEDAEELSLEDFYDRIAECGNACCGSINRGLGTQFPHVGMSTPNIIDKDCIRYADQLDCGFKRHYKITLEGSLTMYASLFVADYGTVDFYIDPVVEEDVSSGELEMF
jgi:hypothetical protein